MIKHRRLKWLGHVLRLNEETPARISLNECIINKKLPVGRPKFTWLEGIKQDLKNVINFKDTTQGLKDLEHLCHDRESWNSVVDGLLMQ